MTHTMPSPRPALPLWQIPELAGEPQAVPAPVLAVDEIADTRGGSAPPSHIPPDERSIAEGRQHQLARGYAEGWEKGLAEGTEKGYADAAAAAEAARAALAGAQSALAEEAQCLTRIVAGLGGPVPALDAAVEDAVVALALEVARCVIGSEVSRTRDYLVRLIREALAKVPIELGALKIVLHPADRDLICRLAPDIADRGATVVADDAVEPGDCRVIAESRAASKRDLRWRPRASEGVAQVDLSIATRWRAVMRALFEDEDK
jgi:flagellar assembly protein FliH